LVWNFVAVQYLNAGDSAVHHIWDELTMFRAEVDGFVAASPCLSWWFSRVNHSAEGIATTAAVSFFLSNNLISSSASLGYRVH